MNKQSVPATIILGVIAFIASAILLIAMHAGNAEASGFSFTATPTSIAQGQASTLQWSAPDSTCYSNDFNTEGSDSGAVDVYPSSTKTYSVTCSGGVYNGTRSVTVTVTAGGPPSVNISANPSSVVRGNSSVITWSSSNATSCSSSGFPTGGATNGSAAVTPDSTSTYYIDCSGPGGSTGNVPVTITVTEPQFDASCTVSPTSATIGQSVTWSASVWNGVAPYSFSWFGENLNNATGQNVSVSYASPGEKNGSVTINDSSSNGGGLSPTYTDNLHCAGPSTGDTEGDVEDGGTEAGAIQSAKRAGRALLEAQSNPQNYCVESYIMEPCNPANQPFEAGNCPYYITETLHRGTATRATDASDYTNYSRENNGSNWQRNRYYGTIVGTNSPSVPRSINRACTQSVTVVAPSSPDLTADTPPNVTFFPGQPVTLSTIIRNVGAGSTARPFPAMILRSDYIGGPETIVALHKDASALGIPNGFPGNYSEALSTSFTSPDGNPRFYRVCVDVDDTWTGSVPESNENNNCSGYGTITVSGPDLTSGKPPDITTTRGQSISLNMIVTNSGNQPTGRQFPATLWVSSSVSDAGSAIRSIQAGVPGGYPAGLSETFPTAYTPPASGTYYYRTCSDLDTAWNGVITETDESNNCGDWGTITVGAQPDLTADYVSTPVYGPVGQPIILTSIPHNIGGGSTGQPFAMTVWVSPFNSYTTDPGVAVRVFKGTSAIGIPNGYPPGVSETFTTSYIPDTPGGYVFRTCVDSDENWSGVITESDEANNCSPWDRMLVQPAALSCSVNPATANQGDSGTYTVTGGSAPYVWTASDGASVGTGSSVTRTFTNAGTYGMTVAKSGYTSATCPFVVTAPTSCTGNADVLISGTPNRVKKGSATVINWSASNVRDSCTISGPGFNQVIAGSGAPSCNIPASSASVTINTQSTYTIDCGGVSTSTVVNVIPNFSEF